MAGTAPSYRGVRRKDGRTEVTFAHRELPPRTDLRNYSDVFDWDLGEAATLQLSLALLAHHLGDDERALEFHREFRDAVVRKLPREGWVLTVQEIAPVLKEMERRHVLKKLEQQLGFVLNLTCPGCHRRRTFCAPDQEKAAGHADVAGWLEHVGDGGVVVRLCPDCHVHRY